MTPGIPQPVPPPPTAPATRKPAPVKVKATPFAGKVSFVATVTNADPPPPATTRAQRAVDKVAAATKKKTPVPAVRKSLKVCVRGAWEFYLEERRGVQNVPRSFHAKILT